MDDMKNDVVKTYAAKGSLQQFRLSKATPFDCGVCGKSKKAKLVTVRDGNWDEVICNGCYGQMLSEGKA